MNGEEQAQEVLKRDDGWIGVDLGDLRMTGSLAANLLVGGVGHMAVGVMGGALALAPFPAIVRLRERSPGQYGKAGSPAGS